MREVLADVERWHAAGQRIALATVVSVAGSAPRGVGAALAVSAGGEISGSVSNGCVEPAVIDEALQVIRSGMPTLLAYGITEAQNVEQIGLSCGGEIRVFVQRLAPALLAELVAALRAETPIVQVLLLAGGTAALRAQSLLLRDDGAQFGGFDDAAVQTWAQSAAATALAGGQSGIQRQTQGEQSYEFYIAAHLPQPALIIVGAGHIAVPLTRMAKVLGYHVTVIDARAAFATHARLPEADEVLVEWPDEALARLRLTSTTAVAVLTHDDKFDVPALRLALSAPTGYVGAIGSRGTRRQRDDRLRAEGVPEEQLARIHGPIGLDIGARTPEEIALAILAEVVATRRRPQRTERRTQHADE